MAAGDELFILGTENEDEYDAFFRLLERGTDFSLAFVFCDDKSIEEEVKRRLKAHYPIKELSVPPDTCDIYGYLEDFSPQLEKNEILFVDNLHQLIQHSDQARIQLGNLNLRRDLLPKIFFSPVIFWLSIGDEAAFIHNAPDFWSWRGACFYFYPHYPDRGFIPEVQQPDFQSDFYQKTLQEIKHLKEEIKEAESYTPQTVSLKKKQAGKRLELSDKYLELSNKYRDLTKYSAAQKEIQKAKSAYQEMGSLLGEANCIQRIGDILFNQSDNSGAKTQYDRAIPLYQKVGSLQGEANCIRSIGDILFRASDNSGAKTQYDQALPLYQKVGDLLGEANCIKSIGDILLSASDNSGAKTQYERALPLYQKVGDLLGEANCIQRIGDILFRASDNSGAKTQYDQALPLYQKVGNLLGEANCLQGLAKIKMARKEYPEAKEYLEKAKEYYRKISDQYSLGYNHRLMGDLSQKQGLTSEALQEYRTALKLFQRIGLKRETQELETLILTKHI